MAEFEKQREKSGRKKSTLLPRNSTDNGSIPPHHPSRANERNGRKKNGVKKIEKKEETTITYTLYTHCTHTVHTVKGRGTTARRKKSFSSWRGTNCRGARTRAIQSVRGADLREAREQRAKIPIGTVGYFIATGPQRLIKINT